MTNLDHCLVCDEIHNPADSPLCRSCLRLCPPEFDDLVDAAAAVRHLARIGPPAKRDHECRSLADAHAALSDQIERLLGHQTDLEHEIRELREKLNSPAAESPIADGIPF